MSNQAFIDGNTLKVQHKTFCLIVAFANKTFNNKYTWHSAFHYRSGFKHFDTPELALKASAKCLKYKIIKL